MRRYDEIYKYLKYDRLDKTRPISQSGQFKNNESEIKISTDEENAQPKYKKRLYFLVRTFYFLVNIFLYVTINNYH